MAIVETHPVRMTPTVLLSQSLGPLTGRSMDMWPRKTGHTARNKTTPVCSKTERRCQSVHKLESLNRVLKRMFCAVLFRAFSYEDTHVCLLSNNSSMPGFAPRCIATPNAKTGVGEIEDNPRSQNREEVSDRAQAGKSEQSSKAYVLCCFISGFFV